MSSTSLLALLRELHTGGIRFVLIGVAGANYYVTSGGSGFYTKDRDFFLPPDPTNLLGAWEACERAGMTLWSGSEELDRPRDRWLAEQVVRNRALTRATDATDLLVDLTLVMAGFEFDAVWSERRTFRVDGVDLPVARLEHIVESKRAAGRRKDVLFLETWAQVLADLLGREAPESTLPPPSNES